MDIHSQDLACNVGGETGTAIVAEAPAGSQIKFQWNQVCTTVVYPLINADLSSMNEVARR